MGDPFIHRFKRRSSPQLTFTYFCPRFIRRYSGGLFSVNCENIGVEILIIREIWKEEIFNEAV